VLLAVVATVAAHVASLARRSEPLELGSRPRPALGHAAGQPGAGVRSEQGAYEQGLALARQATELDPANAAAWNNAGLALIHLERPAEAQAAFEEALALQPESALYWNNLAGALREQGDLAGAERVLLDQALHLDPHLPSAHLSLGIVYLRADRPDLAAAHLEEAVRLLPPAEQPAAQGMLEQTAEPERWLRLGDLLLAHGELEGALWAFEQADALGGAPADVGAGLSAALIALGEWDSAIRVLNQALEIAPADARLYNNLGLVAREQGNWARARELFERAAELAPEWDLPQDNLETIPLGDAGTSGQP
jgi:protein O-GlcNAc transferase